LHRGFIKLWRRFMDTDLWSERRKFSKAEAWLDLIMRASGIDREVLMGWEKVSVPRGTILVSQRGLANRWKWSRKSVASFLGYLKREQMIRQDIVRGMTQITICSYDTYNPQGASEGATEGANPEATKEPAKSQQGATAEATRGPIKKKVKEGEKKLKGEEEIREPLPPSPASPQEETPAEYARRKEAEFDAWANTQEDPHDE